MLVGTVKPDSIVIMGQVVQHIRLGLLLRLVAFFGYPFRLQATKKAFHRGIVPAISSTTHALFDAKTRQLFSELATGVMTALVGMKHHLPRTSSGLECQA